MLRLSWGRDFFYLYTVYSSYVTIILKTTSSESGYSRIVDSDNFTVSALLTWHEISYLESQIGCWLTISQQGNGDRKIDLPKS